MDKQIEPISFWWCDHCKEEVDGSRVTFQEHHDTCGYMVRCLMQPLTTAADKDRQIAVLTERVNRLEITLADIRVSPELESIGTPVCNCGEMADNIADVITEALAAAKRIQEGE